MIVVAERIPVPRSVEDDYSQEQARARREFAEGMTGASLTNVGSYSFDPATVAGNIESFIGVAQVPIGLAGPLTIDGEHAKGDFYVPLATTEGTLVASYNRGMRVLSESGGVKVTILRESMQRAPVFLFDDARGARDFGLWLEENFLLAKQAAESTTSVGRLIEIQQFPADPICTRASTSPPGMRPGRT